MDQNRIDAMRTLAENLKLEGQTSRSECVLELCNAVEELKKNTVQWQPIETAPDDGRFLVYMPDYKRQPIQAAVWHTNVKVIGNAFALDMPPPTHWMPLPPPPTPT